VLVGTLACGEAERDACRAAVARQTLAPAEHRVIEGLAKREAHAALYGGFVAERERFDLLVKVDADMVLCRDTVLERIAEAFVRRPAMQKLSIDVHDWFTDRPMNGLNAFRNTIEFSADGDGVFTDRFDHGGGAVGRDRRRLAPAAWHCPDPHPFQAFHFGVHRGVKAAVAAERGMHETAYLRCREVQRVWRHFRRDGDRRLGLAALGGEWGMQGRFGADQLDYDNAAVRAAFAEVAEWSAVRLAETVAGLRRAEGGPWPWWVRMERRRGGAGAWLRCGVPVPARKAVKIAVQRMGGP
jgi:hypothetical protein